ncbi:hypothetical protein HPB50_013996 [Hyalomma asiaticum]|uniref:Uncharacterized protein n=1 Tax=Hyalomma asiaticum TaxID=266040 RepID=A0ACB7SEI2_HYAAI|nr:hypothetical protein HPB50_013996 [Hyalomma asiaticum]
MLGIALSTLFLTVTCSEASSGGQVTQHKAKFSVLQMTYYCLPSLPCRCPCEYGLEYPSMCGMCVCRLGIHLPSSSLPVDAKAEIEFSHPAVVAPLFPPSFIPELDSQKRLFYFPFVAPPLGNTSKLKEKNTGRTLRCSGIVDAIIYHPASSSGPAAGWLQQPEVSPS